MLRTPVSFLLLCTWMVAAAIAPAAPPPDSTEPNEVEANLPEPALRLGRTTLRHAEEVTAVALSPDGNWVASAGPDGAICVWEVATGRQVLQRKVDQIVTGVTFVEGGKAVAWVLPQGQVSIQPLWSEAEPRAVATSQPARLPRFSRDGTIMAAGQQNSASVVRLSDGNCLCNIEVSGALNAMALSPDGNRVATMGYSPQARGFALQVCSAVTGKPIWETRDRIPNTPHDFSPDGRLLATFSQDGKITLLDANTGAKRASFASAGHWTRTLRFSPDSKKIACATDEGLRIWDANTGARVVQIETPAGSVCALDFSADGSVLATAGPGRMVGLWSTKTGKSLVTMRGHFGSILQTVLLADGRTVISASSDGTVRRWDLRDGNDTLLLRPPSAGEESSLLALSADGQWAVSRVMGQQNVSPPTGSATIWGLSKGTALKTLDTGEMPGLAAFSVDGQYLAVLQQVVRIWDVGSGRLARQIEPGTDGGPMSPMVFSPDGKMLAWGVGGGVRFFEVATGKSAGTLELAKTGWMQSVAFSPDGRTLAAAAQTDLWLYDLCTGAKRLTIPGGPLGFLGVAFSPDGRRLSTGGTDGTILIWNLPPAGAAPATQPADANDLETLWRALADSDPAAAYLAIRQLTRERAAASAFLGGRLKPAPVTTQPADLGKILADLDSDDLRVREQASRMLAAVADADRLRQALAQTKSDEVRARLTELLNEWTSLAITRPEELRQCRAVQALELVGDAGARDLLSRLASGGPSRLTRDAAAALGRLRAAGRRPPSGPARRRDAASAPGR